MDLRLWSLLLAAVCGVTVEGFKNGKVTAACDSMVPLHDQHSPSVQPSSPYMVTVDKRKFSPGDKIKVSILPSGSGAKYFEGFLLEARDAGHLDGPAVGSFDLVDLTISQLLNCGNIQGSAVSHTSKTKKTEVQVIWNAPKDSPPSVQFLATVVQHYSTFWVKIPAPVVSQNGVTPLPTRPTMTVETTTPSVLPKPFSSEGCGSKKSCLRGPVGCHPETDPDCFFLSFAPVGHSVVFELSGPAEGYVAFALSLDKWMGNDDVYQCVRNGDRVDIEAAYVKGRTHPEGASGSGISDAAWRLADGIIQCRFRREVRIPQDHRRFDLDKSYYLFLANGRAEYGKVHRHDRQPLISTYKKVITGSPENMNGSRSPLMMKFHGALMLVAWMTAATTGIIIARYFKPSWPDRTIFGQKVWFQVHRVMMILVVLLTGTGFILPFIYRGGWSSRAGAHPYLGCTVMTLAVLQPFMAIFRPPPDSARRYIFNWMHMGAGTSAVIIAVAAMFLGVGQQALLLPTVVSNVALVGFAVWFAVAFLVLELQKQGLLKRETQSTGDDDPILFETSQADYKDSMVKNVVLAVFIIGNVGFVIALLCSINSV
ncbi:putative ferric-chelate reductase 1 [Anguilla anguilla]|uniref:Ferric-chelate reductase 1 n=1 Tax=Anguilla anguilla TaxID=7936 RepID=A0A9D3MG20_ANGAN|nr:putative ferric-chelate reductase 1 [Anguilla anguilla]KAG5847386.1 hypothetical protein ANANG_G00125490 [Anguilla anguilla]